MGLGASHVDFYSKVIPCQPLSVPNRSDVKLTTYLGHDLPKFPDFDIEKLIFQENKRPGHAGGLNALATVSVRNDYPIKLDMPTLQFDVLVPNCAPARDYLLLGAAKTMTAHIVPNDYVHLNVTGLIRQLPKPLTTACRVSNISPLDSILGDYLDGKQTTVYVRGGREQDVDTPDWITVLIRDMTVALPLPGHPFGNLVRNFSLADVHFDLPDLFAIPNSPEAEPKLSAHVKALVSLPGDMNFDLDVDLVRADADVFYNGDKLGRVDLHKWQKAQTSKVDGNDTGPELLIQTRVEKAPLHITDDNVFTDVIQQLIFSGKGVTLEIEAAVDVHTSTVLGEFAVRDIPAKGKVFVKPIAGGDCSSFKPMIGDLKILETTKVSLTLQASVNITNPSEYSARVPYVNLHILSNGTLLGHATAENLTVLPGNNTGLLVKAVWQPAEASGGSGGEVGRNLLSEYISGYNTTLTLKTHESTIPSQPSLGKALSSFEVVIDTPKIPGIQPPEDNDGDGGKSGPRFIKDATVLPTLLAML